MFAIAAGEIKLDELTPEKPETDSEPRASTEEVIPEDAIEEMVTITMRCRLVVIPRTIGAMKSVIVFIVPVTSETRILRVLFTFSAFCNWIESEINVNNTLKILVSD